MLKKIAKISFIIILVVTVIVGLFIGAIYNGAFGELYTEEQLKEFKNETATIILSEDNKIIGKYFSENRTNISYEKLPKHLVNALVATEDARYFEHEGVDSRSLLRVLFKTILLNDKTAGGGSTIDQQLAKNMYGRERHGLLTMPINKTKEVFLAKRLEKIYTKEEILTLYLNTVPFGENVLGIEAASRRYFNKSAEKLKIEESAILVGMLKANTYYNPRLYPDNALMRRNIVLTQMEKYNYLNSAQKDSIQQLPIKLDYANLESEGPANYFLVQVKDDANKILKEINKISDSTYSLEKSGLIIKTTLNLTLQNNALNAFKSHLSPMQNRLRTQYRSGQSRKTLNELLTKELKRLKLTKKASQRKNRELFSWNGFYTDSISVRDSLKHSLTLLHAGFLALEPHTGAIKIWVGGIDFRTQPYDQIFAQRQVASTFKPILYATALENGISPCDYLDNDKLILTDFDYWQPQNYDKTTGGKYSVSAALSKSLNIPTVNLFLQTPFNSLDKMWHDMGFSQNIENKPSIALGTANASIYELAIAYASFANKGYKVKPQSIMSIKTSDGRVLYQNKMVRGNDRILSEQSAFVMNAILQKAIQEGTGASLKSKFGISLPLAGKTGTSQDYADAWFAAYSPKLVLVTRVGASSPIIKFNSGINGAGSKLALPLVAKTLQSVQRTNYLKRRYFPKFEPLPEELTDILLCEDYTETKGLEKFFENIFKNDKTTLEKAQKRAKRRAKRKQRKEERKEKKGSN
jgi:penicillin-binding protein 1A